MLYTKRDLMASDKDALLEVIEELRSKLKKKNELLMKTRTKLANTRTKLQRMKATVAFQRGRILQLYPSITQPDVEKEVQLTQTSITSAPRDSAQVIRAAQG